MTRPSFNPLRRKSKEDASSVNFKLPPPKIQLHNQLAKLSVEDNDEFEYISQRLSILRRQNARMNKSATAPRKNKADRNKLTVVLDLDETLIHSKLSSEKRAAQDIVSPSVKSSALNLDSFQIKLADGEIVTVYKRPGLDEFLKSATKTYELMVYTAGLRQYAEPLLNWLDPKGTYFRFRLYRDSCLFTNGHYVKDLNKVNRDLKRTVLVDNNVCCFIPQLSNGIPISSFYDDPTDDALEVLTTFLESLNDEQDIRPILSGHFKLEKSLGQTRDLLLG